MLPSSFTRHEKKQKLLEKSPLKKPIHDQLQIEKPEIAKNEIEKLDALLKLEYEEKQYCESCPDLTCEMEGIEIINKVRASL